MSRGGNLESIHAIESCAFQLLSWRPFAPKPLDSDSSKPCYGADRSTSLFSIDAILDMSKLSLFDDDRALPLSAARNHWFARKRRRCAGSRSVSGRSSDRRGCSVGASAANGTCSDFPMVAMAMAMRKMMILGFRSGEMTLEVKVVPSWQEWVKIHFKRPITETVARNMICEWSVDSFIAKAMDDLSLSLSLSRNGFSILFKKC